MRRAGGHQGMRSEHRRTAPLRASQRGARGYGTGLSFGGLLAEGFPSQAILSRGEAVPPSAVREDKKGRLCQGATRSEHNRVGLDWGHPVTYSCSSLLPEGRCLAVVRLQQLCGAATP